MRAGARTLSSWIAVLTLGAAAINACTASNEAPAGAGGAGTTSTTGQSTSDTTGAFSGGGVSDFDGGSASGTGGLDPDSACATVTSTADSGLQPADIIIVVDTSGSMDEESAQVQANLNTFASLITGSGIDVHVILIADSGICISAPLGSGSCPADENLPTYQHVPQVVSSTDALDLVISTYPLWKSSLRANASKTIAIVSDDDSQTSAATFTSQLLALDPPTFQGFKLDAIVSFEGPAVCTGCFFACAACASSCCDKSSFCVPIAAAEGKVYKELVTQTGGVLGNLCVQDFTAVFQDMATAVVQGSSVSCVFDIPSVPDGGVIDPLKVNVTYTPGGSGNAIPIGYVPTGAAGCGAQSGGWYYDDPASPSQIILCDATCNGLQGDPNVKVDVLFGCDTIIAEPQ